MRNPDETLAAIDNALIDWCGSPDAMVWTPEKPSPSAENRWARWGWGAAKVMAFSYLLIASTYLTAQLILGTWGGTPHDPLWLNAVATGVGAATGLVAAVFGVTTIETIRNRPR
ncbi:hypothetical protein GCM10017673_18390 [Streptosporangium violaceochromogenes]|nr:hypothetical protein GCM10017673_18390 [Streptosporangium violaceochromogenes]